MAARRPPIVLRSPPTPWPEEVGLPEEVGFLARLARLTMLTNQVFEGIVAPFGLSFNDYLVLAVTRRSGDGGSSPTHLCRTLGRTTGGMTLTLDRLEAAGWLRRGPAARDRRRVAVTLTAQGQRLATRVNRSLHDWELGIQPAPVREELCHSLDRLLAVVDPTVASPTGASPSSPGVRR